MTRTTPNKKPGIYLTKSSKVNTKLTKPVAPYALINNYCGDNRTQVYTGEKGFTELVIGLDFGTANTKVVVMEEAGQAAWAVPFTKGGENPYLLPSALFFDGSHYSLNPDSGEKITDLKLSLLAPNPDPEQLISTIIFLALVIRHARCWFLDYAARAFHGFEFDWLINMGLPAADYDDKQLVTRFSKLLRLAANIATYEQGRLTRNQVVTYIADFSEILEVGDDCLELLPIHPECIGIYPEIAAQLHGYVQSDKWDRNKPKFMLVDIGGSTVDAAIVNVTPKLGGKLRLSFLKSCVKRMGTVILHKDRIEWIRDNLVECQRMTTVEEELDCIQFNSNCDIPLQANVQDYLDDVDYHFPGEKANSIDNAFCNTYGSTLYTSVIAPVKGSIDTEIAQWKGLQFLICGGGSAHPLYQKFVDNINQNTNINVKLDRIEMEKPDNLIATGCSDHNYHRLSVAYGLAQPNLGEVIRESEIPLLRPGVSNSNGRQPTYVGQELM